MTSTAETVVRQMTTTSGARLRKVSLGVATREERGRGKAVPRWCRLGQRCAGVDGGSVSEHEIDLPMISESAYPLPCRTQTPI